MPFIEALNETPLAFDNDVFTHLRKKNKVIEERIRIHFAHTKEFPALPAITIFEAHQGIEESYAKSNISIEDYNKYKERINELQSIHRVLSFDDKAAKLAAQICAKLGKSKSNNLWYDILIVCTAVSNNFGLATVNKKDMEEIAKYIPSDFRPLQIALWKPDKI